MDWKKVSELFRYLYLYFIWVDKYCQVAYLDLHFVMVLDQYVGIPYLTKGNLEKNITSKNHEEKPILLVYI